jgi:Protein kinase domain.
MSPEIIELQKGDENHYYAPGPADIYACGIILYFMLTGTFPYGKASEEDVLFKKYIHHNAQFWKEVKKKYKMSVGLVELLNGILNLKTECRYTFEEILTSKWIQKPRLKQENIFEMILKIQEIKHQKLTAKDEAEIIENFISEKCEVFLSQE